MLQIFDLFITAQFTVRSILAESVPGLKQIYERGLRETSSDSRPIFKHDTGTGDRRPFIASTSRRKQTGDSDDPRELYARSVSEIQMGEETSGVGICMRGDINGETRLPLPLNLVCLIFPF